MSALLFIFQVSFFFFISRWLIVYTRDQLPALYFLPGLSYKLLAGWGVGLLYTAYYQGGDTWAYYQDSLQLSSLFYERPSLYLQALFGDASFVGLQFINQPRALFFTRICSIVSVFSLQNYWLISLSFSASAFLASWWLMAMLKKYFQFKNFQLFIPFIIYPSVTFWSSGLLKESLAVSIIFFLVGIFLHFYFKQFIGRRKDYTLLALWLVLALTLWKLKYYYAAILLPLLCLSYFLRWLKVVKKRHLSFLKLVLLAFLFIGSAFLLTMQLHPNLNPDRILQALVLNHDLTVAASQEGAYVAFSDLKASPLSFVRYFPKAIFNGLFGPLPGWWRTDALYLIAGLENLLLLILSLWALVVWLKNKTKIRHPLLILTCFIYLISLAGFITIASPNYGSLLRYRVAYMPFFTLIILVILEGKMEVIFSKFRKKM